MLPYPLKHQNTSFGVRPGDHYMLLPRIPQVMPSLLSLGSDTLKPHPRRIAMGWSGHT
jgi:hypothetical protein